MRLGYLVHNLNDPAVERRCNMLERGGAQVILAGFCRETTLSPDIAARAPMVLGTSADAAMTRRAVSTLGAMLFHRKLSSHFNDCDMILVRNLEQLAIARAIIGQRPLVYECLDIHRSLVGTSLPAKAIQRVEAALLPRVDLLITSSPAFHLNHFIHTSLKAPIELVENKLYSPDDEIPAHTASASGFPIRIGWFGMLRCRRTLEFLSQLAREAPGRIEVLVAGKPSSAELPHLESVIAATPGMQFVGPYKYSDLPRLYGQCQFAWTVDWFEEGLNSSWLLPNRLYEPLAFGVVPIALRSVEVGRWLETNKVGLVVETADQARDRLMLLSESELDGLQAAARAVDPAKLVAGSSDCLALVERLSQLAHA